MYDVEAPKKAIAHIQNTAPGPPNAIAVATPAMLPVPTRPASETASAWNEDTLELDDLLLNIRRSISGTPQTCMKRVRIEKYRPGPRHSPTSAMLQMMSLSEFRNASTYRDPSSCPGRKPTAPVVSDGCNVGCARGREDRNGVVEGQIVSVRGDTG